MSKRCIQASPLHGPLCLSAPVISWKCDARRLIRLFGDSYAAAPQGRSADPSLTNQDRRSRQEREVLLSRPVLCCPRRAALSLSTVSAFISARQNLSILTPRSLPPFASPTPVSSAAPSISLYPFLAPPLDPPSFPPSLLNPFALRDSWILIRFSVFYICISCVDTLLWLRQALELVEMRTLEVQMNAMKKRLQVKRENTPCFVGLLHV